jgi:hypothetical protein
MAMPALLVIVSNTVHGTERFTGGIMLTALEGVNKSRHRVARCSSARED